MSNLYRGCDARLVIDPARIVKDYLYIKKFPGPKTRERGATTRNRLLSVYEFLRVVHLSPYLLICLHPARQRNLLY